LTRNLTSLLAFSVGEKFDPKTASMKIVAVHTDSPALKLGPNTKMAKAGCLQVVRGVEDVDGGAAVWRWHLAYVV
jgi:aspartyl aminopeptidase